MSEILNINISVCRGRVGYKFWEVISREHGIEKSGRYIGDSDQQLEKITVYYNESVGGRYIPRGIFVGSEASAHACIREEEFGILFQPDNFIFGMQGAGGNWAKGHYTQDAELIDTALDLIRKEAESSQLLQGFQVNMAIGGGAGSPIGTLLISKLLEEYPENVMKCFAVFPAISEPETTIVYPYNCVLSLHQLTENANMVIVLDNEGISDICREVLGLSVPSYSDLNTLISGGMSGATASLRFPTEMNSNMYKMANNLVPYPRLHFLTLGMAPITLPNKYLNISLPQIALQLFEQRNIFSMGTMGKYLAMCILYRGRITNLNEYEKTLDIYNKFSEYFVEYIPNNLKFSATHIPPRNCYIGGCSLSNNTSFKGVLMRIREQFLSMFERKAFLHWYTGEGMEEDEFIEAGVI